MINRVNLTNRYLEGTSQVMEDYSTASYKYIEVSSGYVCTPAYDGSIYCRNTGSYRNKIAHKQYLRLSAEEYMKIYNKHDGSINTEIYEFFINHEGTTLRLP